MYVDMTFVNISQKSIRGFDADVVGLSDSEKLQWNQPSWWQTSVTTLPTCMFSNLERQHHATLCPRIQHTSLALHTFAEIGQKSAALGLWFGSGMWCLGRVGVSDAFEGGAQGGRRLWRWRSGCPLPSYYPSLACLSFCPRPDGTLCSLQFEGHWSASVSGEWLTRFSCSCSACLPARVLSLWINLRLSLDGVRDASGHPPPHGHDTRFNKTANATHCLNHTTVLPLGELRITAMSCLSKKIEPRGSMI